ncbi:MAG: bifunctional phosphoglucose/phosphomannose isomerase [Actinobacteria bacterium]|nr:bifunctional phosphoglucose/phosphomannose isomerase [Actinomycetota bacterium]
MTDLDDLEVLRGGDPGGMLATVADLPSQCAQGYSSGRGVADLPSVDDVTAVTFCGMGGSAVAGDVLRTLYRERLGVPFDVSRGPTLPAYCGPHTLVIASSYSGETSETLACFREAVSRGCRVIALSSGGTMASEAREGGYAVVPAPSGLMPRAALGHIAFGAISALESVGLVPQAASDVEATVTELTALAGSLGPDVPRDSNDAKELAWRIGDRVPVVWGAEGPGAVAAARWKTQFNENAKIPAWWSSLPELDHNEVVGWTRPTGDPFMVIALRHEDEHTDVAARFPLSLDIAREAGAVTAEQWAAGSSALARLFSLILMGDFTSTYLGLLRGADPSPIAAIVKLKAALAESPR